MTEADRGRMIAQAMMSELEKIAKSRAAFEGVRGIGHKMMQLGGEMIRKGGVKGGEKGLVRTGEGLGSFLSFHGGKALKSVGRTVRKHPKKSVGAAGAGLLGTGAVGGALISD